VVLLTAYVANVRGDLKKATKDAETADRLAGANQVYEIKALLGELYARQQQWGLAANNLQDALRIQPMAVGACIMLGQVYLQLGESAKAIKLLKPDKPEALRKALEADANAIKTLIRAHQSLKQYAAAQELTSRLAQMGGQTTEVRLQEAGNLLLQGKQAEAEGILKELLNVGSGKDKERAAASLVDLYRRTNRKEEAKKLLDALLAAEPENRTWSALLVSLATPEGKPSDPDDPEVQGF